MKFIEEKKEAYQDWYNKNSDSYSRRCFTYAEDWANLMESRLEQGQSIKDCAKETSHEADTDGITGFMYSAAVSILSNHWIHGEELRQWHNLEHQLGNEGQEANKKGTVLNTAVLNIG